jgi:hypothetical protein
LRRQIHGRKHLRTLAQGKDGQIDGDGEQYSNGCMFGSVQPIAKPVEEGLFSHGTYVPDQTLAAHNVGFLPGSAFTSSHAHATNDGSGAYRVGSVADHHVVDVANGGTHGASGLAGGRAAVSHTPDEVTSPPGFESASEVDIFDNVDSILFESALEDLNADGSDELGEPAATDDVHDVGQFWRDHHRAGPRLDEFVPGSPHRKNDPLKYLDDGLRGYHEDSHAHVSANPLSTIPESP